MNNEDLVIRALEETISIKKGEIEPTNVTEVIPKEISVHQIRDSLHLTQKEFADRYGFTLGTVRNWEQGIRTPDRASRILLRLIERQPDVIQKLISEDNKSFA